MSTSRKPCCKLSCLGLQLSKFQVDSPNKHPKHWITKLVSKFHNCSASWKVKNQQFVSIFRTQKVFQSFQIPCIFIKVNIYIYTFINTNTHMYSNAHIIYIYKHTSCSPRPWPISYHVGTKKSPPGFTEIPNSTQRAGGYLRCHQVYIPLLISTNMKKKHVYIYIYWSVNKDSHIGFSHRIHTVA